MTIASLLLHVVAYAPLGIECTRVRPYHPCMACAFWRMQLAVREELEP
jgi:hypothetical protein